MPVQKSGGGGGGKKKHRGQLFDFPKIGKDFLRGGKEAARGFPTGIKVNAKAVMALRRGDPRPILRLGEQSGRATATTVRHPLRDPFSTFLTGLAAASAGAGIGARGVAGAKAISQTGKVSKGLSAAAKKPVYTRSFKGLPAAPGKSARTYTGLQASPNPVNWAARKPLDAAYEVSRRRGAKRQKKEFGKHIDPLRVEARKLTQKIRKLEDRKAAMREREKGPGGSRLVASGIDDQIRELKATKRGKEKEIRDRVKEINKEKPLRAGNLAKRTERRTRDERERFAKGGREGDRSAADLRATGKPQVTDKANIPMNILRWRMFFNLRYWLQNMAQSGMYLGIQQGPHGIFKSTRTAGKLRNDAPEIPGRVRGTMGDPAQSSGAIETFGEDWFSRATRRAAHVSGKPEARLRELAFYAAARAEGITKPADFQKLFRKTDSPQFHRIARKANESVLDFSRRGQGEAAFMRSGIPIFYPMWKASTRYTAKFPTEHSVQAALYNQIGQRGYEQQQEDFPGGLPSYAAYLVKAGKKKNGRVPTVNPQNIHPFSAGVDVMTALAQMFQPGGPPETGGLAQYLGPMLELALGASQGRSLQTGWPLKGVAPKKGARQLSPIEASFKDFLPTVPGYNELSLLQALGAPHLDWAKARETKAYGQPSPEDMFKMWLVGPGLGRRSTKISELTRGAKREKNRGR